ncbi:MAG TPA: dihydropteroate synthase, partial [Gammaproteobacteria bacterium]|nr:dihydropteroate synthase [Gammaproteobacteria bacterium]
MQIYLGLGSNLGDRREHLRHGIAELERAGVTVRRVSPVVESAALLPHEAPAAWNRPFLNLVLDCEAETEPDDLRRHIKRIEQTLGRAGTDRWSPRPLDIDILLWGTEQIATDTLTIPHPHAHLRNFVLTPLVALEPRLRIPGCAEKTALEWSIQAANTIPLWMGIINLTPDSFSDGGRFADWTSVEVEVERMLDAGVHIIDLGAESTRPGAAPLSAPQEWQRLEPVLTRLQNRLAGDPLRPRISIDTYHADNARRALERGVDMINDVTGLTNPAMIELAGESAADWVAMHSLGVPVHKTKTLPSSVDPRVALAAWLDERIERWQKAGVDLNRVIFDPGIGFGKDPLQSLELLRAARDFRRHGLRVLIGHSRKSFFGSITTAAPADRDVATLGVSLALCAQGVDVLRVHDVTLHAEAYRGWSHVAPGIA